MSHGSDNISCFLVKKLALCMALPLSIISVFLYEGILPDIWKVVCIVPFYRGRGSKDDVGNYRPTSLTSVISKLKESIIKQNIKPHCLKSNLISPAHQIYSYKLVRNNQ